MLDRMCYVWVVLDNPPHHETEQLYFLPIFYFTQFKIEKRSKKLKTWENNDEYSSFF